jgi:hypothetical protein
MLLLNLDVRLPDRYIFLPTVTLEIESNPVINSKSDGKDVVLKLFETGLTDSFSAFTYEGDWKRDDQFLQTNSNGLLTWHGRVINEIHLTFLTGPDAGTVRLNLNNSEEIIDLFTTVPSQIYLIRKFPASIINRIIVFCSFCLLTSFIFFLFLTILAENNRTSLVRESDTKKQIHKAWWIYALPMIITWLLYLLTYWPGLMNQDSFSQWGQAVQGTYEDWHPVSYAFSMRLLSYIWNSPTVIAVVQILGLSLVIANGIHFLRIKFLPNWTAWLLSIAFAFSPVCSLFSISLLKDVPYAICFLSFFLIILRLVLTDGDCLNSHFFWIGMALSVTGIVLFRHNGLPIVLFTIIVLTVIWYKHWRKFLLALLMMFSIVWIVKVPVSNAFNVKQNGSEGTNQIFLHTISAHVYQGTSLSEFESKWLDQLLPLDQWTYNPWTVGSLLKNTGFNKELFYSGTSQNFHVFMTLTLKKPLLTIKHMIQASDMIWKLRCEGCYLYKVILARQSDGSIEWVINNTYGIHQSSKLPCLVEPLLSIYEISSSQKTIDMLTWRPAFYSYLIIFTSIVLTLRFSNFKFLLVALLPSTQSLLFMFISFAQDMRFQLGVILVGLFSLGLLFLPKENSPEINR